MRSLLLLPQAISDLEEIADYIALDNPRRAVSFIDELRRQCRRI
ncbi:type II toxin-antitoxin system RelE/ParE family toxin [Massilia endophytica]|nr:type II toxin-antitoxin system RelE/ParE family toxin [Massilia endophytica]UGQ46703.1 type II toxin-antitoxin system RelE/ParE family toxin [Massilia endophytica]